jgi:thiol-disulfide isomerase/thioredoxin
MHHVLLGLCCLLLAACTATSTEALPGGAFVEGAGASFVPPAERSPAPAVSGTTLDGEELALADLPGPVVVNFWASWCGPCVQEAPDLAAVHEQYGDRGVSVIGVNIRDAVTNARRFEADLGVPYPSWHDEAATIAASFGGVGPGAVPTTILLDAEHRVAARLFGAVTFPQVRGYLDRLLDEAA